MDTNKNTTLLLKHPVGSAATASDKQAKDAVSSGNRVGRGNRRRESWGAPSSFQGAPQGGSSNSANPSLQRYDPQRKPAPQKTRAYQDKRPKTRGYRSEVTQACGAEPGSAYHQGSRKQNLNHLLNFSFAPRDATNRRGRNYRYSGAMHAAEKWTAVRYHKYNKEEFLQANCQFVVQEGGNYTVHAADPDLLVNWELIEQVRLLSHEVLLCPICLYPPKAAKITRCGHIYCWPCMLHYLALSDKTWRKCPICYEAVHKADLKSVVTSMAHQYAVGDQIVMKLMRRERGSVVALPKSAWRDTLGQPFQLVDKADNKYAKLLVASPADVRSSIIDRERNELQATLAAEEEDCPENMFISAALELLTEREKQLRDIVSTVLPEEGATQVVSIYQPQIDSAKVVRYSSAFDDEAVDEANERDVVPTAPEEQFEEARQRYESTSSDGTADLGVSTVTADDLDFRIADDSPNASELHDSTMDKNINKATYYFYQASDGQHIYMHALNVRMLVREFGSLEFCPDEITAKIVEKEGTSMNEDLRHRLRYLGHLPLTCEFEVVELVLSRNHVSVETMLHFKDEIEKRRRRRTKRARDERRRERNIQMEENRKIGRFPGAKLRLESRAQFPDCLGLPEAASPAASSSVSRSSSLGSLIPGDITSAAAIDTGFSPGNDAATPSFAQMLREGKSKPVWPTLGSAETEKPKPTPTKKPNKGSDDDELPEDYVPAPNYRHDLSDAIKAALERANNDNNNPTGQKKKKNNKKANRIVLASGFIYNK